MAKLFFFLASLGLILFAAGCHSNEPMANNANDVRVQENSSIEPVAKAGNSYRAKLTQAALRGLDFESGRVQIDAAEATAKFGVLAKASASTYLDSSRSAYRSGQIIKSLDQIARAIVADRSKFEAYEQLGILLLAKRKKESAEAAFRTALDLNPDSVKAHRFLAMTLTGWPSRYGEAISEYEKVVELDPEYGFAYARMAVLHFYQQQPGIARKYVALAEANDGLVPAQFKHLLEHGPDSPQPRTGNAPIVGERTRVDFGNRGPGNETTASASNIDVDCVIVGWNDYRVGSARSGFAISTDGGETWQDQIVRPPLPFQSDVEGDPMTAFDDRTGNLWAGAISFGNNGGVYVARKNKGNDDFQPPVMAIVNGDADKGWMAAGPDPVDPESTRLYIGYNQGLLVSVDEGDSWSGPTPFPEFGLGWLPRVGPNGELYLTYWDAGFGVKLLRSFDGGQTLEGPITIATRMDLWFVDGSRFPGRFRCAPLVTSAVDPDDGTLYATWFDTTNVANGNSNVDIYFSRSTDQGSTWSVPTVINTDAAIPGDQFFSFIEVDGSGRLHVLFYDSRSVVQDDNTTDDAAMPSCILEAYYAYSDDGGESWSETILTPQAFDTAAAGFEGRFIGDYLGIARAGTTVYPCYLDTNSGTADVFVHRITNETILGDLNGDGVVNLSDVDPFVAAIVNGQFKKVADINGDGSVDVLDVAGFLDLF